MPHRLNQFLRDGITLLAEGNSGHGLSFYYYKRMKIYMSLNTKASAKCSVLKVYYVGV